MIEAHRRPSFALNGLCPYFTMFPLTFPFTILHRHAHHDDHVLDPFCGRGTTNYASRLLGLHSTGIDSSPVAAALSAAKIANTSAHAIVHVAQRILSDITIAADVPSGDFWEWAYHAEVLHVVCRLREGLIAHCRSDSRKALRAILMGALHGPLTKTVPSYLSNQCQRTYAPKPRYAVNFWKRHGRKPPPVDVLAVIARRAQRYYGDDMRRAAGRIIHADSREKKTFRHIAKHRHVRWVITSPPYYGLRTYVPDQWLRGWFVGGDSHVDYAADHQVTHTNPESFAADLQTVWRNVGMVAAPGARLVVRFGGINDRKVDPLGILRQSLTDSGWRIEREEPAGTASKGRRQALHFSGNVANAIEEYDVWATWQG